MSMRTILLLACLAGATGKDVKYSYFGSAEYVAKAAGDKQQDLWNAVSADRVYPEEFPGAGGIFVQPLGPAFTTKADASPPKASLKSTLVEYVAKAAGGKQQDLRNAVSADPVSPGEFPGAGGISVQPSGTDFTTKPDALPPKASLKTTLVGTVGKIRFIATADPNPYTGCFKGADHGLIRFSAAVHHKDSAASTLLAGVGLKFFRKGIDSANLVAVYGVDRPPADWQFFYKDFSTIIEPSLSSDLTALASKSPTAKDYITSVGLSDVASNDQTGHKEASVKFPFSLRFKAHVKTEAGLSYVENLLDLPADAVLFDVYAMDKPAELGGEESLIGTVQLVDKLVTSRFGDANLFFSHQEADADIKIHHEWEKYYPNSDGRRLNQMLMLADDIIV